MVTGEKVEVGEDTIRSRLKKDKRIGCHIRIKLMVTGRSPKGL